MFIVVARYKVKKKFQKRFKQESSRYFSAKMRQAPGFIRLLFLRNVLDPEFIDVVTEWSSWRVFMDFIRRYPHSPPLTVKHEILDRYLFESI